MALIGAVMTDWLHPESGDLVDARETFRRRRLAAEAGENGFGVEVYLIIAERLGSPLEDVAADAADQELEC